MLKPQPTAINFGGAHLLRVGRFDRTAGCKLGAFVRCRKFVAYAARVIILTLCVLGSVCEGLIAQPPETGGGAAVEASQTASDPADKTKQVAGNSEVAEFMQQFQPRGVMSDGSRPTPPDQVLESFATADGVDIELVASEPQISQPLFVSWDSRGRMWVVQYRQYQFPAGLKVVRYDQHLRAVFDRVPPPPPAGPVGADRITVFEDTDQDGQYDQSRDVIQGLNIATSVQIGHGGIWVLNPPYLLFYPDVDRDGLPDGEPEVHLSGFGLQDTHSVANSLLWGPDGWLYGASGSTTVDTVSSQVTKGVHYQGQCIWRYHPDTREFEIYAEGGGNTFSLDIDAKGRVFSGTNGGGTRGFYYPQGSYSHKNWGKHGPLTNPYAFGFFQQMAFEGDPRRFAQAFAIYEGGLFPASYRGDIIAPNAMTNLVWHSERLPQGSTFRTVDNENLLESSDRWFRPVYCGVGPEGAIYIADWYDTRLSHVSPFDDWHKESGRIYRLFPDGKPPSYDAGDLHTAAVNQLLSLLAHQNKWVRQRAVLELGWRQETSAMQPLVALVDDDASLEALWAVNLLGGLDAQRAQRWMASPDPHIRRWVVRLLGDRHQGHPAMIELASKETDVQVRSQLAATAKRIESGVALPILKQLIAREEDLADPHMPLMIWWGLEAHCEDWSDIKNMLSSDEIWSQPLFHREIASRLMQRYASSGKASDLETCAQLIQLAPNRESREQLLLGLDKAFRGRPIPSLPQPLDSIFDEYRRSLGNSGLLLSLRQGAPGAVSEALQVIGDRQTPLPLRMELVSAVAETQAPQGIDPILRLATGGTGEPALQRVAIAALRNYDAPKIGRSLVSRLGSSISAEHQLRDTACRTLAARRSWSELLLKEVLAWRLREDQVPTDVVQQIRAWDDEQLNRLTIAAFGPERQIASEEKLLQMQHLRQLVSSGVSDADSGQRVFMQRCGVCHQLFGEGKPIGPPLDAYDRGNLDFWLPAIVEPSLEIREGYQSYSALTQDGRIITGMIAAQDDRTVTIRGADNLESVLVKEDLVRLKALSTSLMPEDVLKDLSDQQIRDLFAYLSQGVPR